MYTTSYILGTIFWIVACVIWYNTGKRRGEIKFRQAIGYHLNKLKDDMDEGNITKEVYQDLEHKTLFSIFEMITKDKQMEEYARLYELQREEVKHATTGTGTDFNQT